MTSPTLVGFTAQCASALEQSLVGGIFAFRDILFLPLYKSGFLISVISLLLRLVFSCVFQVYIAYYTFSQGFILSLYILNLVSDLWKVTNYYISSLYKKTVQHVEN